LNAGDVQGLDAFGNACVVGRHDNGIKFFSQLHALDNPLDHWLTRNHSQTFTWKPCGPPPGRNDADYLIHELNIDAVINVQGDEPLIDPSLIDELAGVIASGEWDMATAATPIEDPEQINDPSVVKALFNRHGQALYFSRSTIPHIREPENVSTSGIYWRHIGIYAYRRDYLLSLVAEPPCALENLEKLEQLRALDMGCRMKVIKTQDFGIGVDTPEDVAKAEALLASIPKGEKHD
jgi:CMP-2-keto-3-deoxyoctulosonic acid synthetase